MLRRSITSLAVLIPCALAARGVCAAALAGLQHRHMGESEQLSGGYDGPGPCGVSPPHRARLGGHSCLPAKTAAGVHSTPSTLAAPEHAHSGSASSSNSRVSGGGAAQPSEDAAGALSHPRLSITLTLPACRSETGGRGPPFPIILFLNGFQLRAGFYAEYARRLATWGYAVLQYDTGLLRIIDDRTELQYLNSVLDWLAEENARPGGYAEGLLDLGTIGVAGHSRGAKLAALHLVGDKRMQAAYLVDPVDNTRQTPEGPTYPSAVRALRAAGLPVGITGAGLTGSCNPADANHQLFYSAAGANSWHEVVVDSGHAQFCDAGPILNRIFAALCRAGPLRNRAVIGLALPPMTAWFDQHLRTGRQPASLMQHFREWTAQQQASGRMQFETKEPDENKDARQNGDGMQMPVSRGFADMLVTSKSVERAVA